MTSNKNDFDVDFDERRRGEVIRYVSDKYGDDRVAQIVTFGTIKAKQALKDSARVLGLPYGTGEKLTKLMPSGVMGKEMSLDGVIDKAHLRVYGEERLARRERLTPPEDESGEPDWDAFDSPTYERKRN